MICADSFELLLASADNTTVEAFMPSCEAALTSPGSPEASACGFYVSGVADVFTSNMLSFPVCSPEGTTGFDVLETFVTWARNHPEHWDQHVYRGIMAALAERYRC